MTSGTPDHSTKKNAAVPKRGRDIVCDLIAISALVLHLTQAPFAHADSDSCPAKVSAYVAELDELLSKERNWITPYMDLRRKMPTASHARFEPEEVRVLQTSCHVGQITGTLTTSQDLSPPGTPGTRAFA